MNPFRKTKIQIDAIEAVDISLVLNTVLASGVGDEKFRKRMSNKITYLQETYKKQVEQKEQAEIAQKIMKRYGVKLNAKKSD